jgi:hypothetical protein
MDAVDRLIRVNSNFVLRKQANAPSASHLGRTRDASPQRATLAYSPSSSSSATTLNG